MASTGTKAGRVARAFSQGMIRQAEMVGRPMLANAMQIEADVRAEGQQLASEERAKTETMRQETRQDRLRKELFDRQDRIRQEDIDLQSQLLKESRDFENKTWLYQSGVTRAWQLHDTNAERMFQIRQAMDKSASDTLLAKMEAKIARATEANDTLGKLLSNKPDNAVLEPTTGEWRDGGVWYEQVRRAENQVRAAWQSVGLPKLISDEITGPEKWRQAAVEIAYLVDVGAPGPEDWKDIVEAIRKGDKDSKAYKEARERVVPIIKEWIKDTQRVKLTPKEENELTDQVFITIAIANLDPVNAAKAEVVGGNGEVLRFKRQVGDPIDKIDEANLEVGAYKKALAAQGRPGRSGPRGAIGVEWRDPAWLLPRLESELNRLIGLRDSPGRGGIGAREKSPEFHAKIARVKALILKMKSMIKDAGIPAPFVDDKSSLRISPQRGMINQNAGMLSPQALAHWEPEAVEARNRMMS